MSADTLTSFEVADPASRPLVSRPAAPARNLRLALAATLLAALAVLAAVTPGFATPGNIANVIEQSTILALLAFGMTLVIVGGGGDVIRGGIDLSLGANLGLCAALYTVTGNAGLSDGAALLLTLAAGAIIGLLNALAVVGLGILPLLATLAVMNVCGGLELVLTQNTVISSSSPLLAWIANTGWLGLSATSWVAVSTSILLIVLVGNTHWGLRLQAIGGHPQAARAAGLSVALYRAASYVASGLLASVAAILQAARLSGSSPGSGDILLSVVLTSLMSAVFSRRALPSIGGTVISVLFIGCLVNAFQLLDVSSYWVNGVQGLLILCVVALRALSLRQATA